MKQLPTNQIEECKRVQVRQKVDRDTVSEYAEDMRNGAIFPPIVVYQEKGTERFIVADGHHRLQAALRAKQKTLEVDLHEGDESDALEFALGSNQQHGARMSKADRLRAVNILMTDPVLSDKYRTDAQKGDLLGITARYVQQLRVTWRESPSKTKKERVAKKTAGEKTEKFVTKAVAKKRETAKNRPEKPVESATCEADVELVPHTENEPKSGKKTAVQQAHINTLNTMLELAESIPYGGGSFAKTIESSDLTPKALHAVPWLRQFISAIDV